MKRIQLLLLVIIFFVGVFFRFIHLGTIPIGFHLDEAIIGDNANFILHTGRDTDNVFLPLQTEVFGDYNPTGYAFLAIPSIKLLGLTEFATRFPGALLGSLTVVATFFLVFALFESTPIALLAAAFFAVSPWDIVLSRSSEETAVALFFVVSGFACLIYSIRKEQIRYLVGAFIFLTLSYFMYFTPRVFVPLFFLSFFIPYKYWWGKRREVYTKLFITTFLLLGAISFFLVFGLQGGASRFNQVSIFGFPATKLIQEEQIREDGVKQSPLVATRFFHNKPFSYAYTYVSNYLAYFSGDFLFMQGGPPIWFRIPQMGLFYLIELPFILYAIFRLCIERKKWTYLIFTWILLGPVAAAVTVDDIPNIRRALVIVPLVEALTAYGMVAFFATLPKKSKKVWFSLIALICLLSVAYFSHEYFIHAPINKNWYINEGFDTMVRDVKKVYNTYDHIVVTKDNGGMYSEVLFYMHYDPATYLKEGATKDAAYTGFGKFFFVPQACPAKDKDNRFPAGKILYVEKGTCGNAGGTKEEYIYRQDGSPVFHLVYE